MARPRASSTKISQGDHDEASANTKRRMNEIRSSSDRLLIPTRKDQGAGAGIRWVNVTFPFGEL